MESALFFVDAVIFNSLGLSFVALGALISFRFAGFPDLTIDGSFTFGAALYALSVAIGVSPMIAFVYAMIGGAGGGISTAVLNRVFQIGQIISGIIVMIFLLLIIPYFSGSSTVGLLRSDTILTTISSLDRSLTGHLLPEAAFSLHILFSSLIIALLLPVVGAVYYFFASQRGTALRYVGSAAAPDLLSSRRQSWLIIGGLAVGNALIALGGAIEAERSAGFSQNMGVGMILIAVATLVLGESVWKAVKKRANLYLHQHILAVLTGVVMYATAVQLILMFTTSWVDIRLMTTALVAVLLAYVSSKQSNIRELF